MVAREMADTFPTTQIINYKHILFPLLGRRRKKQIGLGFANKNNII